MHLYRRPPTLAAALADAYPPRMTATATVAARSESA